ncbi:MAG TPA: DUF2683 family protein [Flavobacterium sp.]|nr:DUF2683 family protein [Flavobacterium sp.]
MEITIKIDKSSKQAKAFYEYLKTLPFVEIESSEKESESPYDPEFVVKILKSAGSKKRFEVSNVDKLWDTL